VLTAAQVLVRLLQGHLDPDLYSEAAADPLFYGLFAAIGTGAFFGWRRSRPIENVWQSGVIAVLAAVGALLIGFLAALADRLLGLAGLLVWGIVAAVFGVMASRWSVSGTGGAPVT
jgi:hypothetical protein